LKEQSDPRSADHVINAYLREITKRLKGPRRSRRLLADEVRDHLHEASATIGDPDTVRGAITATTQFGEPAIVAERLQSGLSRRNAPRVAVKVFATSAGLGVLWLGVLLSGPHEPWLESAEPKSLAWADAAGSTAMKAALGAAALAFLLGWLLPRIGRGMNLDDLSGRWAGRLTGIGVGALAVFVAAILGYVALRGYLAPHSLEWSDIAPSAAVSLLAIAALAPQARSTILSQ
jgi:hypothetical protein